MAEKLLHHGFLVLPDTRPQGVRRLEALFSIYKGASPVDRTGTLTFPTALHSIFPLPEMRCFDKNYAELCEQRAVDLVKLSTVMDVPLYVFWSGGVDSTLVLSCLLKHCPKDRLTVLLTENSIREYPLFFNRYLRKLRREDASRIVSVFAEDVIVVNGEGNDQLFGSDVIGQAIDLFGVEAVIGPLQRELITSLYQHAGKEHRTGKGKWNRAVTREEAHFFSGLFGRLIETAPVDIKTNFDLLWWINFVLKWQTVYMRPLLFSKTPLYAEHIRSHYKPFFHTPEFELWSMNNMGSRIHNDWKSYKWQAKKVIYDFTSDACYRDNKVKFGSLAGLVEPIPYQQFIDEDFQFHQEMDWYQPSDLD